MKKVFIKTLGCEKNTVDSENAAWILEQAGCVIIDEPKKADAIIVNTCSFINDAKTQSIESIFELNNIKKKNCKLIVSGCLGQRYASQLAKSMPEVDVFLGVNDYSKIADMVLGKTDEKIFVSECPDNFVECGKRKLSTNPWTRSLRIAEGCNNRCSYCAIPLIRGKYRSRLPEDIVAEAEDLAKEGCRELVIIAQDVTFYGKDLRQKNALCTLLRRLCKIEGIKWIRLMYCYEDEITDELIDVIKSEEKIVKYIDIPIQHSVDCVLKNMNRKSTNKSIRNTIKKLRESIPEIVIRTTLITGFPGETKDDFTQLYDFVEDMKFDRLGVFAYSKEEGTKAFELPSQVRKNVREKRRDQIMALQQKISLENNQKYIGRVMEVLVEEETEPNIYSGRTMFDAEGIDNGVIIHSKKKLHPGSFVKVKITDAFDYDLSAEVTDESSK